MILESLNDLLNLLPAVQQSPKKRLQASYYEEADVLHVYFGPQPKPATDCDVTDCGVIMRNQRDEVIQIPILHAIP